MNRLLLLLVFALTSCATVVPAPVFSYTSPTPRPIPACSELEPNPVSADKMWYVDEQCLDPDGSKRWVDAYYQCMDGRIWLVITSTHPLDTVHPVPEPTGDAFHACRGY
jgi:hypothetical protein